MTGVDGAPWWTTFFHGVALDLWRAAVSPEATRAQADELARLLDLAPGERVLDVPCGNGRLTLELARRGFPAAGVDLAGEFVAEAREHARRDGLAVRVEQADMRALPWRDEFDAAFCTGNSFGYFDDDGHLAFARAVRGALRPGGRFVL